MFSLRGRVVTPIVVVSGFKGGIAKVGIEEGIIPRSLAILSGFIVLVADPVASDALGAKEMGGAFNPS
ncbi:MAG: hypothetical protein WCO91_08705 [Gemmataceae bacterium]